MNWRFPQADDIAAAERRVYLSRDAVRWQAALVAAHARHKLRSRSTMVVAGIAGFLLPSLLRTGVGRRVLAMGSMLRWVGPVIRMLRV